MSISVQCTKCWCCSCSAADCSLIVGLVHHSQHCKFVPTYKGLSREVDSLTVPFVQSCRVLFAMFEAVIAHSPKMIDLC